MVAAYNMESLAGLVTVETRERGDDQFVAAAYLQLVHSEQGEIAVCFLGLEFIEHAVGYQYRLWVVQIQR